MMGVTHPVTGLSVHIPEERVKAVQIVDSTVKVTLESRNDCVTRMLQGALELGPFGEALLRAGQQVKKTGDKERMRLLMNYSHPTRELSKTALDEFINMADIRDFAAFTQKYGRLAPLNESRSASRNSNETSSQ